MVWRAVCGGRDVVGCGSGSGSGSGKGRGTSPRTKMMLLRVIVEVVWVGEVFSGGGL